MTRRGREAHAGSGVGAHADASVEAHAGSGVGAHADAGVEAHAGSGEPTGGQPEAGRLLRLAPDCSPKLLEEPCLYNRATDDLYILNSEAVEFLASCANGAAAPEGAAALIDFCTEEGILEFDPAEEDILEHDQAERGRRERRRSAPHTQSPLPSLRYLLLHITDRCNLRCRHCFIGEPGSTDLPMEKIMAAVDEFEEMQGLRLLISGGEPLLHREFWQLNGLLAGRDLRTILLSNGTLIDEQAALRLRFHEVQISLDGMRAAHDFIRGEGNFERSVAAVRRLTAAGVRVSIATMIHSRNLQDFDELAGLIEELGVREWAVDLPSVSGRLAADSGLMVDSRMAGPLMNHSFCGAIHEPAPGYACGAHLMAGMADGGAARCGFYAGEPVGTVSEGLAACWQRVSKIPLEILDCDCELIEDCRGGCRFRAAGYNSSTGADLCQCYRYGVL